VRKDVKSSLDCPIAQIIQAAVDVGIAKAALRDTIHYVHNYSRPWIDVELEHGYEDPLTIYNVGNIVIQVHAAEALLRRSGEYIDRAIANPTDTSVAEASVAVAEAKALCRYLVLCSGIGISRFR
jgi:alkylation response protein AidB-like acyl-CoA dehydrogenase